MRRVRNALIVTATMAAGIAGLPLPASAAAPNTISVPATSDPSTLVGAGTVGDPIDLAVGEQVTLRMDVDLPESTTISLRVDQVLPAGLDYVSGSAVVSYMANTVPSFNGDFAGITGSSTPTFAFPASRVTFDSGTRRLSFDFGSVINNDGDVGDERLIIEMTAVVVNGPGVGSGDTFSVGCTEVIDEGLPTESTSACAPVHFAVVEPALGTTAQITPAEVTRGGSATLTIEVSNLAADGATGPLHDIVVADVLDDWLHIASVDVAFNGAATTFGSSFTDNSVVTIGFASGVEDELSVVISGLPVDGVATITVALATDPTANLASLPRTIFTTVDVDGDSLATSVTATGEQRTYSDSDTDDLVVFRKPVATITTTTTSPTNDASIPFTVTFDENVTGFTVFGLTLTAPAGATITNFTAVDARTYTFDVTGMTADGDVTVTVEAGAASNVDSRPNAVSEPATVTYDGTAPTITGPAEGSTLETTTDTGAAGAVVEFELIGENLECTPNSGTFFAIGATTVTCTAEDDAGNVSTRSFAIEVTDDEAPVIGDKPDLQLQLASGASTVAVTFASPAASDNSGSAQVVCTPASGTNLPVGTHTVTCTATDASTNTATSSFTVTVTRARGIPSTGANTFAWAMWATVLMAAGTALLLLRGRRQPA